MTSQQWQTIQISPDIWAIPLLVANLLQSWNVLRKVTYIKLSKFLKALNWSDGIIITLSADLSVSPGQGNMVYAIKLFSFAIFTMVFLHGLELHCLFFLTECFTLGYDH